MAMNATSTNFTNNSTTKMTTATRAGNVTTTTSDQTTKGDPLWWLDLHPIISDQKFLFLCLVIVALLVISHCICHAIICCRRRVTSQRKYEMVNLVDVKTTAEQTADGMAENRGSEADPDVNRPASSHSYASVSGAATRKQKRSVRLSSGDVERDYEDGEENGPLLPPRNEGELSSNRGSRDVGAQTSAHAQLGVRGGSMAEYEEYSPVGIPKGIHIQSDSPFVSRAELTERPAQHLPLSVPKITVTRTLANDFSTPDGSATCLNIKSSITFNIPNDKPGKVIQRSHKLVSRQRSNSLDASYKLNGRSFCLKQPEPQAARAAIRIVRRVSRSAGDLSADPEELIDHNATNKEIPVYSKVNRKLAGRKQVARSQTVKEYCTKVRPDDPNNNPVNLNPNVTSGRRSSTGITSGRKTSSQSDLYEPLWQCRQNRETAL